MSLDTDEFARLLSSELDASRQLNELLQQELSVVTSHQPMALDTLNPAKEKQVAILRASAGLRLDWMEVRVREANQPGSTARQPGDRVSVVWDVDAVTVVDR